MNSSSAQPGGSAQLPQSAQLIKGSGGLRMVQVNAPAAAGAIYLLGATVTSWRPRGGEEVLFVSEQTNWDGAHAIRGGVPICFPWFGAKADDPKAPAHGFVRAKAWELDSLTESAGAVTVTLSTGSDAESKRWWPADFHLVYRATFGSTLTLELEMTNTGGAPLRFEEALHTYHLVGDIAGVRLRGLEDLEYIDKTDGGTRKKQQGEVAIVSETDRVYLNSTRDVEAVDPAMQRRIHLRKESSRCTVVWNPWMEKAKSLKDFGDDEWKQMICLETCNVGDYAIALQPGERHTMHARISVTAG